MRLKVCWFGYFILACCWGKALSSREQMIKEFKSALLPMFGFKDRPKLIDEKVVVPEALKELYQRQEDFDLDTASFNLPGLFTQSANTVRSFTHVESPIDDRFAKKHHHKFRLKFDVSSIPKEEVLKAAELKVVHEVDRKSRFKYHRIVVNDIIKPGIKGRSPPIMRVIDSKVVETRKNGTVSLDIFPAVERWLANPRSNHGILVVVHSNAKSNKTTKKLRLKRDLSLSEREWALKQPLLFAYTDDGTNKQKRGEDLTKLRSKRAPRKGHRKNDRDPCRRRQMNVDFREVGWSDWIVAPLGYDAFYCDGECEYPMAEHMNTTNHAIIQSMMNSVRPNDVPKPCCVPTQLSSISMLYLDSQKQVILKNYKEMVVTGCGCR